MKTKKTRNKEKTPDSLYSSKIIGTVIMVSYGKRHYFLFNYPVLLFREDFEWQHNKLSFLLTRNSFNNIFFLLFCSNFKAQLQIIRDDFRILKRFLLLRTFPLLSLFRLSFIFYLLESFFTYKGGTFLCMIMITKTLKLQLFICTVFLWRKKYKPEAAVAIQC